MDTAAPTAHALMMQSLEAVAGTGTDLVPRYFERFFALYPAQEGNFHNRVTSRGGMVNEMLTMLLAQAEGAAWVPTIMRAQVATHYDHGDIALEQYRGALDLLVEVLAEAAGQGWDAAQERAWRGEAERLFALIADYF